MSDIQSKFSTLAMREVYIDKLLFERENYEVKKAEEDKTRIHFDKSIDNLEKKLYKVSLSVKIWSENEFNIESCISGIFEFRNEDDFNSTLLSRNTVAILFPYLRSQITLITSQPGFEPIILPVININKLLEEK